MGDSTAIQAATSTASLQPDPSLGEVQVSLPADFDVELQASQTLHDLNRYLSANTHDETPSSGSIICGLHWSAPFVGRADLVFRPVSAQRNGNSSTTVVQALYLPAGGGPLPIEDCHLVVLCQGNQAVQIHGQALALPAELDMLVGEARPLDVGPELLRAIAELEDPGLRRAALPLMERVIEEGHYELSDVMHQGRRAHKLSCTVGEFLIDADTLHVTAQRLMRVLCA